MRFQIRAILWGCTAFPVQPLQAEQHLGAWESTDRTHLPLIFIIPCAQTQSSTHSSLFLFFLIPNSIRTKQTNKQGSVPSPFLQWHAWAPKGSRLPLDSAGQQTYFCALFIFHDVQENIGSDCQGSQECLHGSTKCTKLPTCCCGEAILVLQGCFHSRQEPQHMTHLFLQHTYS